MDKIYYIYEIKNIKKSLTGNTLSEETKNKISQKLKGKKLSEETKEKMRQAALKRSASKGGK